MKLARVLGPVWGARHVAGLDGAKLLEVEALGFDEHGGELPTREILIAIDQLGAGPGERVLVAHGSRVRDLTVGAQAADKDVVVAIVDGVGHEEIP